MKREQASSQSDEESDSKRERRKKKKSRWSDDPPAADIKPPGVVAPLPPSLLPGKVESRWFHKKQYIWNLTIAKYVVHGFE